MCSSDLVRHMCETLAIMHNARFVEFGSREDIYRNARHIYTRKLIAAIPDTDPGLRDANAQQRQKLAEEYEREKEQFYDKNGQVYDLKPLNKTHFVAMPEASSPPGGGDA